MFCGIPCCFDACRCGKTHTNNHVVTWWTLVVPLWLIGSYFFDIGSDIYLAYSYLNDDKTAYGILTILFVFIPALCTITVSSLWYLDDGKNRTNKPQSKLCYCLRILCMVFLLAPVVRCFVVLGYAWKSHRAKKDSAEKAEEYYIKMKKEDSDATLLRVYECFLESAPQLILQIAIIMTQTAHLNSLDEGWNGVSISFGQGISIFFSTMSISCSLVGYQRSVRAAQEEKKEMSCMGSCLMFAWHMCFAVSRVLSFSVMASFYPVYTGILALCHWLVMTFSLMKWTPPGTCEQHCYFNALILGCVYLFQYIPTKDEKTRKYYAIYYGLVAVENALMFYIASLYFPDFTFRSWYFIPALVIALVTFLSAVIFMVVYYLFCHPNKITNETEQNETIDQEEIKELAPQSNGQQNSAQQVPEN